MHTGDYCLGLEDCQLN